MSLQAALPPKRRLWTRIKKYRTIYLMLLPVVVYYILFHYVPMGGLVIAFENYKPAKGIFGSEWVGLKNFEKFLTGMYAGRVIRNTLTLNLLLLAFGFPAPIILALMMNEMKDNWYKKTLQTVSYMPHFVALVVVCGLLSDFCMTDGLINDIIAFFGGERVNLLSSQNTIARYMWCPISGRMWAGTASFTCPPCPAWMLRCMRQPPLMARAVCAASFM